jgi:hypothetical protein
MWVLFVRFTRSPRRHGADQLPISGAGDFAADHRPRVAHEALELKPRETLEQKTQRRTPARRILIRERRHGLALRRDSKRPTLDIVAAARGWRSRADAEGQRRGAADSATETMLPGPLAEAFWGAIAHRALATLT